MLLIHEIGCDTASTQKCILNQFSEVYVILMLSSATFLGRALLVGEHHVGHGGK